MTKLDVTKSHNLDELDARPAAGVSRRAFFGGAIAAGAAGVLLATESKSIAQTAVASPQSGDLIIKGGHVLSMDDTVGDFVTGDVHVRDGRIVAVGEKLEVAGAAVIDATDRIVMPGLVDTHSHLWNAFLRGSVRGDDPVRGYFPTTNRAAPHCTPRDAAVSARFGALEQLLSGVTCINNFSHNTRSTEHADAEIQAMLDVGVRSRFSYGAPGRGATIDRDGVSATIKKWGEADPSLKLGVNLQLPSDAHLKDGTDDPNFLAEVRFAKDNKLPISFHFGNTAHGLVAMLDRNGLLGPDILMIHPQGFTAEEREAMVKSKVMFSTSPAIEIPYSTVRNGYIQFDELQKLGAVVGLSADATAAMATGDYFLVIRALQWAQRQRSDADRMLAPKRYIQAATIDGAKALGLDAEIGSISLGKWADIITVRKSDMNMAPVIDPYNSLVYSGAASNVDLVMVAGKIIASNGSHAKLDKDKVTADAKAAGIAMHEKLEKLIAEKKEDPAQLNRKG